MCSYNPYSLSGKRILITGASSGIGRTTAIECSKLGAQVVITARNEQRLSETLSMLEGDGHQMIIADLNKSEDIDQLIKSLPQIDGFVCCAGIMFLKMVNFVKNDDLHTIFETNTMSCILLTKSIMRAKKMNKNGSMVFVSSMAARQVTPGNSLYAASKAAIESFSRSCAVEYASKNIRSNAVLPAMVETPMITKDYLSSEEIERDKDHYLLKRYGKPEEIAWAIIYLLSDASSWTTNTSLIVSGGGKCF